MSNKYKKRDISSNKQRWQVKQVNSAQARSTLTPHHRNSEKFHFQATRKIQAKVSKNSNINSQEIRGDRKNPCRYDILYP